MSWGLFSAAEGLKINKITTIYYLFITMWLTDVV